VLKWARANGCPWDSRVRHRTEDQDVRRWAFQNDCPVYPDTRPPCL